MSSKDERVRRYLLSLCSLPATGKLPSRRHVSQNGTGTCLRFVACALRISPIGPVSGFQVLPTQGFSEREAQLMLAVLQENIANGAVVIVPVDWQEVHSG